MILLLPEVKGHSFVVTLKHGLILVCVHTWKIQSFIIAAGAQWLDLYFYPENFVNILSIRRIFSFFRTPNI